MFNVFVAGLFQIRVRVYTSDSQWKSGQLLHNVTLLRNRVHKWHLSSSSAGANSLRSTSHNNNNNNNGGPSSSTRQPPPPPHNITQVTSNPRFLSIVLVTIDISLYIAKAQY